MQRVLEQQPEVFGGTSAFLQGTGRGACWPSWRSGTPSSGTWTDSGGGYGGGISEAGLETFFCVCLFSSLRLLFGLEELCLLFLENDLCRLCFLELFFFFLTGDGLYDGDLLLFFLVDFFFFFFPLEEGGGVRSLSREALRALAGLRLREALSLSQLWVPEASLATG